MSITPAVHLKPIVRFREFPFGTASDPPMQEFMRDQPWPNQERVLDYLRSGVVLSVTMGASLTDWFDRPNKANPVINGQTEGGTTEMTDGVVLVCGADPLHREVQCARVRGVPLARGATGVAGR